MSQPVSSTALTPKKNLRGTMALFLSIVIGIFLFLLVAVVFGQSRGALMPDLNRHHTLLTVGMVAISFVCLFLSRQLFAKAMAGLKNSGDLLNERLNLHRAALLKYLVLCEIPVMLSIIVFLLTGNFVFQVYAGIFIGFMLTMMPTRKKVTEQLGLSSQE
ncbi:MAG: hypothetical protein ABW019_12195, partial [Chitinophagaceae bacterium]